MVRKPKNRNIQRKQRTPSNKHVQEFDVLLQAKFVSAHDGWDQFLCMQCKEDKTITLSNRWHEILGTVDDLSEYYDEDRGEYHLPEEVNGKKVWDMNSDHVLGEDLVLLWDDPEAEITLAPGERERALLWLSEQGWDDKDGYAEAWAQIAGVLGVDPSTTPVTKPWPQVADIRSWMPEMKNPRRERWSGYQDIRFRTKEEALDYARHCACIGDECRAAPSAEPPNYQWSREAGMNAILPRETRDERPQ
jgi:hypothetical protein